MEIKYYLKRVTGLTPPKRANSTDAGYDVIATSGPKIVGSQNGDHWTEIDYVEYETNLYFVPKSSSENVGYSNGVLNFHTDLRPRSSISSKTNFVLANSIGLIDRGYHNQVLVRFKYVWQPMDLMINVVGQMQGWPNRNKMYAQGDAIAQILPTITHDIKFEMVDSLPGDDRGGGFGSTDANRQLEQKKDSAKLGFQLIKKTDVDTYYRSNKRGRPLVTLENAVSILKHCDGDVYEFSEGSRSGICVMDGAGQILTSVTVFDR